MTLVTTGDGGTLVSVAGNLKHIMYGRGECRQGHGCGVGATVYQEVCALPGVATGPLKQIDIYR